DVVRRAFEGALEVAIIGRVGADHVQRDLAWRFAGTPARARPLRGWAMRPGGRSARCARRLGRTTIVSGRPLSAGPLDDVVMRSRRRHLSQSAALQSAHAPSARARPARSSQCASSSRRRLHLPLPLLHRTAVRNAPERGARALRPSRRDISPASLSSPPPTPKRPQGLGPKLVRGDYEDGVRLAIPLVLVDPPWVDEARLRLPTLFRLRIDVVTNLHEGMLSPSAV